MFSEGKLGKFMDYLIKELAFSKKYLNFLLTVELILDPEVQDWNLKEEEKKNSWRKLLELEKMMEILWMLMMHLAR